MQFILPFTIPYIICQSLSILLSNVLTLRESSFVTGLSSVGMYLSIIYMIFSVAKTNRFGIVKTAVSIFLTLVGIVFVLFLFVMFYSLMGQLIAFIKSIYNEIMFRI